MKKWILVGVIVLAFGAFAIYQHSESAKPSQSTTITSTEPEASTTPVVTTTPATDPTDPVATATPPSTPTTPVAPTGQYKDGTYTGSVANAFYGNLQVSATISGGKLADVQFLQFPNSQGESQEVNGRAMPLLKSEAIAAQSAKVNVVSGATQSSQAFVESLGNALSQAKA